MIDNRQLRDVTPPPSKASIALAKAIHKATTKIMKERYGTK